MKLPQMQMFIFQFLKRNASELTFFSKVLIRLSKNTLGNKYVFFS